MNRFREHIDPEDSEEHLEQERFEQERLDRERFEQEYAEQKGFQNRPKKLKQFDPEEREDRLERLEDELEREKREKKAQRAAQEKNTAGSATAFFKKLFTEGVVTKEAATEMLPFLLFLSFLCMLYIGNSHMAIKSIRTIDKLGKEVKELSTEYKTLKADLMFKSKLTEVAKQVDTLGIKELVEPPKKIVLSSDEY